MTTSNVKQTNDKQCKKSPKHSKAMAGNLIPHRSTGTNSYANFPSDIFLYYYYYYLFILEGGALKNDLEAYHFLIFLHILDQHHSSHARPTKSIISSNIKIISIFNTTLAQGIGASIAHIMCCFLTTATYMPT